MTAGDRARGDLVQVLAKETVEVRQPISAVSYRNTQLAARIACFLDFLELFYDLTGASGLSRPALQARR